MLSEKQCDAIEETAAEMARRRENRSEVAQDVKKREPRRRPLSEDEAWARRNLRIKDGKPYLDIANALRVFERHEEYAGRFRFNETLNKVMDKGAVMLDWRVAEAVAIIQERFLPEIPAEIVEKALVVHANRVIQKK